jgi:hypothetical protein
MPQPANTLPAAPETPPVVEVTGPPELLEQLVAAGKTKNANEVIRQGQTCAQATSNKPFQATCKRGPLTTHYYVAARGTDAYMRDCLKHDGTWSRNESHEAHREALEQQVSKSERELKRLGL